MPPRTSSRNRSKSRSRASSQAPSTPKSKVVVWTKFVKPDEEELDEVKHEGKWIYQLVAQPEHHNESSGYFPSTTPGYIHEHFTSATKCQQLAQQLLDKRYKHIHAFSSAIYVSFDPTENPYAAIYGPVKKSTRRRMEIPFVHSYLTHNKSNSDDSQYTIEIHEGSPLSLENVYGKSLSSSAEVEEELSPLASRSTSSSRATTIEKTVAWKEFVPPLKEYGEIDKIKWFYQIYAQPKARGPGSSGYDPQTPGYIDVTYTDEKKCQKFVQKLLNDDYEYIQVTSTRFTVHKYIHKGDRMKQMLEIKAHCHEYVVHNEAHVNGSHYTLEIETGEPFDTKYFMGRPPSLKP